MATRKDFAHFVGMAISSCNEVENHVHRSLRLKLLSVEEHDSLTEATIEVRKMAYGLRKRLLDSD